MPQPIDMQTEIGRLLVAERMQDAAAKASLAALQRGQAEEARLRRIQEVQVNETPEAQSEHVDGDGRGKKDADARSKRRRSGTGEEDQSKVARRPGDDHHLDVSI